MKQKFLHMFNQRYRRSFGRGIAILAVLSFLTCQLAVRPAQAATMTLITLLQTRIKAATTTDVTLQFTVPTGVDASTDTITITFDSGYDLGTFALADYDFEVGSTGTCSSATFTDKTLATSATTATWGIATTSSPKRIVTLTAPTDATTGEITAGRCVQLKIGSGAGTGGSGSTVVINPSAGNYDVDITSELGVIDDSGSGSISIIADDRVNVTATVDPYITFTISDVTIGFGALSSAAAVWATSDTNGSASDTAAHTMTLATNAASGYAITYNGATLTSGSDTIDVAAVTNDADGSPGSEQFGLSLSTDGNATIAGAYDHNSTPGNRDWAFVASATTTIVSEAVPTATETISAFYLGNISTTTQPGSYSTNITYIASGTF